MRERPGIDPLAMQAGQYAQSGQPLEEIGFSQAYAAAYAQKYQQPHASYAVEGLPGMPPAAAAGPPHATPYGQVQQPYMMPPAEPTHPPFDAPPGRVPKLFVQQQARPCSLLPCDCAHECNVHGSLPIAFVLIASRSSAIFCSRLRALSTGSSQELHKHWHRESWAAGRQAVECAAHLDSSMLLPSHPRGPSEMATVC